MPNLRYQYIMNEPFVGGIKDTVQTSHEANVHKVRVAYELDQEEELRREALPAEEQIKLAQEELMKKISDNIIAQNQNISTDDIDTLKIKQDDRVDFGLKINKRKF